MHVVATAGHVDHGKSTLVRALTGMEPDRYEEERRRGMTIDLGFAWTTLAAGEVVAFVDVPGHERFVPTMLAGVGPVPAVLLVVSADEGWMPQTAEHVAALHALGVRHGLLAVTRSDLADPAPVAADVRRRLEGTTLAGLPAVAVSARTGQGLPELRSALGDLVRSLPAPDRAAPVRLWVDRSFSIRGSGTVVTGTLDAGTLRSGDPLDVLATGRGATRRVHVRALESLGEARGEVGAVARVAVNLRGTEREAVRRGDVLATPGSVVTAALVDVRLDVPDGPDATVPGQGVLHLGSGAVGVRVRLLGAAPSPPVPGATDGAPQYARLRLDRALPLAPRDVALLRDPGAHRIVARVTVLDTAPPELTRRGAARARAGELDALHAAGRPDGAAVLAARGAVPATWFRATGATAPADVVAAEGWLLDPAAAARWREVLAAAVAAVRSVAGAEPGLPLDRARAALSASRPGLPPEVSDGALAAALVRPPLAVRAGRLVDTRHAPDLPAPVAAAVRALAAELAVDPFAAPPADRLAALGLGRRELAAAERAGAVLRVAEGVVLLPDAVDRARVLLGTLPQPFTTSQARQALGTSRRVVIPLLELLDRRRLTARLPDHRRTVTGTGSGSPSATAGAAGPRRAAGGGGG
jgi:selenocysteine-specific elongation factor